MRITVIFLLCAILTFANSLDRDILDMVLSFVTMDDRPTSVLLFHLCWSSYDIKTLVKGLAEVNVNVANSDQKNRSENYVHQLLFVADLSCNGVEKHLVEASNQGFFKSPYRWLLIHAQDEMQILDALVDSDVVIARKVGDQAYAFIEAYKITDQSEIIYMTRAIWRANNLTNILGSPDNLGGENNTSLIKTENVVEGNDVTDTIQRRTISKYGIVDDYRKRKELSTRRMDIRKNVLTIANVIADSNETKQHLDDRLQLDRDSVAKWSYMVVKICVEMLNSTEKRIFTNTWGYKDKNGSWQGIVNHLIKKEADLGTMTMFTVERFEFIDFLTPGATAVRFVFREPPLALITNIFTLPFSGSVWLAILVCVLGCAVFLYITSKWEATMGSHPMQLDGSWTDVLILTLGAVLQQGCTQEPRYAAGRCVTLLLFVALTILYAAYSANIVVLLRAPSSSIKTIQDLRNSPLEFGASDFAYNRNFFKKLKDPVRKEIYDKKIAPKGKPPNFLSMKEGVERIRKGLFAFHMELNPGYRLIQQTYREDEKCDLVEIDFLNERDPWIPGQKRSPFKELFKINFMKIRESGIQRAITDRLHVPRPRCSGAVSSFSSVGISDMYPALLATTYGMLMAPAVLILEIVYKRLITMKRNRKIRMQRRQ